MNSTVGQISIFLENKIGSLFQIMDILSKADIKIIAATVADTTEFGILRVITNDNARALTLLKEQNKSASTSEVFAITTDASAGSFYNKLKELSSGKVVVEYMYCFSIKDKAILIFKANDNAVASEVIASSGIETITNDDLKLL